MSITKYRVEIEGNNLFPYKYKKKLILNTKGDVRSQLSQTLSSLKYINEKYKYAQGIKKLANKIEKNRDFDFRDEDFLEKECSHYKANLRIKVKPFNISTSRGDGSFLGIFHTALRKFCEGSGSWGLWHWINYCADDKDLNPVVSKFWEMMIASFKQAKRFRKKSYNNYKDGEDLTKISIYIYEVFLKNMDSYYLYANEKPMEDYKCRQQYIMLCGLLEAMILNESKPFNSVVYEVIDANII